MTTWSRFHRVHIARTQDPFSSVPLTKSLEYVEGAIFWSNISNDDKNKVHKGPHSQAPKAEQLSKTLSPVTQVETVHTKTTKGQAVDSKEKIVLKKLFSNIIYSSGQNG